jgi:hypothetical protein
MFPILLAATLVSSLMVCGVTVALFLPPIDRILRARLKPEVTTLWTRILLFAVCVAGVALGTRLWNLERYMGADQDISTNLISMEVYRTLIATGEANIGVVLVVCLGVGVVVMMKRRDNTEEGP